jgi:hypothetical protein
MMDTLVCTMCGAEVPAPRHCGRPMHIDTVDGREMLVCWMGAACGTQPIPQHCDVPMRARS